MLLTLVAPQLKQAIVAYGILGIGFLAVAGISFGVYKLSTQSRRGVSVERSIDFRALSVNVGTQAKQPQSTTNLIEQLRSIDWFQFEQLVALVYRKLGYTVTRRGGANPDGGIDLVVEKGGQRTAVQCKQWKTWNVGEKAVREFLGALTDAGIQRGIYITLCGYTGHAKRLADKHGIEIVNEVGLAKMIEGTDAQYDPETLEILNETRKLCPKCESEMVLRVAKKGIRAGGQFWGCSSYPRCRFTMAVT
jgi:restriction system protein